MWFCCCQSAELDKTLDNAMVIAEPALPDEEHDKVMTIAASTKGDTEDDETLDNVMVIAEPELPDAEHDDVMTIAAATEGDIVEAKPLYDRLGGEAAVNAAVEHLYWKIMVDDALAPIFALVDMTNLKTMQKKFLTLAFGGPVDYGGRSLKDSHVGKGITEAQFDAVASHLSATLKSLGVPDAEQDEVMTIVASTKGDIVEAALKPVVLPLTFRDASGANTYTVNFETKPLCMTFEQNANPVKIKKAFGTANKLGVSVGSELINIGGTDVEALDFGKMMEVLNEKVAPLTPDGLAIDFRDQSGKLRSIVFPTRPLGMLFIQGHRPSRIKSVEGTAQSLGVEANWELMRIDETDVEHLAHDHMLELLKAKAGSLLLMVNS